MDPDELLQTYLDEIESGTPLEHVLASLPADQQDLAPLLSLAVQTNIAAQSTRINPLKAQSQQQRVTAAARQRVTAANERVTAPVGRVTAPVGRGTAANERVTAPVGRVTKAPLPRSLWVFLSAGAAVFAVFALISVAALAFLLSTTASARAATLMDVAGIVEISPADAAADWTPVSDGEKLRAGMHLRTRSESSATLVFYDGSRTALAPHTELVLADVGGGWNLLGGRAIKVRFQQEAGETTHSVVPLKGGSSFFEVLTPAGKASVHGTVFVVDVSIEGEARFAVDRGVVEVSQSGASVILNAGQATRSGPGDELEPPSYQFFAQGPIQTIEADVWTIGTLSFHVDPALAQILTFEVGDWVAVRGRILPDGTFQADNISPARNDNEKLRFTGVVETIGIDRWTISGHVVLVDDETEIEDGIQVDDPVEVNFVILADGAWQAREIERLDADEDENKKTPTPTITTTATATSTATATGTPDPNVPPSPTPTQTATPEVSATPTLESTPTPEGNRAGCEASDKQHPEGLTLAARWGVAYEEIMGWFCQGFGFGEIDLAYELAQQSGKPVAEIFAMKSGGMGWGQIKQELSPKEPKQPKQPNPNKGPKK